MFKLSFGIFFHFPSTPTVLVKFKFINVQSSQTLLNLANDTRLDNQT